MPSPCLDEESIADYVGGGLPASEADQVNAHLDQCERCRRWVVELVQVEHAGLAATVATPNRAPAPDRPWGPLVVGQKVEHYEIQRPVGSGGMSLVYAAYDTELGRTVALKVLRPEFSTSVSTRARLLREAQAMARLAHPNVLTVYEAKERDGLLYIAMELVEGRTLGRWLKEEPRTWPQVVRMFREAARGLAAAHAAGIIHRDFKPENVLIGLDGRARVTDFGLARWEGVSPEAGDMGLTQSGTFLGTPAYMSPEHLPGGVVDARSDQFSFCVALYEGLFGCRPFDGTSLTQIRDAIQTATFASPRLRRHVPGWLRRLVRRGLTAAPEDRFESMDAVIAAMSAGLLRARRLRWLAAASSVSAALVLAWALARHPLAPRASDPPPSPPAAEIRAQSAVTPTPAPTDSPVPPLSPARMAPGPKSAPVRRPPAVDPRNPYSP